MLKKLKLNGSMKTYIRAAFDMEASYFYPPGILATITLLGYVIDISDVRWDFLSSQVAVAVCQVLDLLPVARVKTLRDRLDQPPLPLSACPDTKWGAC